MKNNFLINRFNDIKGRCNTDEGKEEAANKFKIILKQNGYTDKDINKAQYQNKNKNKIRRNNKNNNTNNNNDNNLGFTYY